MTVDEINELNLEAPVWIIIEYNDQSKQTELLVQSNVYMGFPDTKGYPNGELIKGQPPQLLVYYPESGMGQRGVKISDIKAISLVESNE